MKKFIFAIDGSNRQMVLAVSVLQAGSSTPKELRLHTILGDVSELEVAAGFKQLCGEIGVQPSDLISVAVVLGPGSFTGLRVSLGFAKGLALAVGCPLIAAKLSECLFVLNKPQPTGAEKEFNFVLMDAGKELCYLLPMEDGAAVDFTMFEDGKILEAVKQQAHCNVGAKLTIKPLGTAEFSERAAKLLQGHFSLHVEPVDPRTAILGLLLIAAELWLASSNKAQNPTVLSKINPISLLGAVDGVKFAALAPHYIRGIVVKNEAEQKKLGTPLPPIPQV